MGIEPFLITASLNAIVAQRLARRICSKCKEPAEVSRDSLIELQVPEDQLDTIEPQRGRGCNESSDTGYKGRVALYDVLSMNEELKELVSMHLPPSLNRTQFDLVCERYGRLLF